MRDIIKNECQKARGNFELNLANDKKNSKRLFSYINHKQKTKTGIEALLKDGSITYEKEK